MRILERILAALLLTFGVARNAQAEEPNGLIVERGVEAADCPSAAELTQRITTLRGQAANRQDTAYRIAFDRVAGAYSAVIRSTADGSARVIQAHSDNCASLTQATALTLALLFDKSTSTELEPRTEPVPPEPQTPKGRIEPARSPPAPLKLENPAPELDLILTLGAGALAGVIRSLAPALTFEAGVESSRLRLGVGGLWAMPQTLELGPGHIRAALLGASARGCFAWVQSGRTRLESCSGLFAGAQRAEAEGFTTNLRRTKNWFAIPFELTLGERFGALGVEFSASALLPLVRNEFVVNGQGTGYSAAPIAALFCVRVLGSVPLRK